MPLETIPIIRIFLSSPGDVNEERQIAIKEMEKLTYRPRYRNKFHLQIVAWDDPRYSILFRATLTPQQAINDGLPLPSECNAVIVLFWSRMGTPLKDDKGNEFLSGTHWELMNALSSDTAETIIYRRTEKKAFTDDEQEERHQNQLVDDFFRSPLFRNPDGTNALSVNQYETLDKFKNTFELHFEQLIERLLEKHQNSSTGIFHDDSINTTRPENITMIKPEEWDESESPFPGLRSYLPKDAGIFFGRDREASELAQRFYKSRFVAVVGASGSGKSSLVGAGLIPRLKYNAVLDTTAGVSSKNWLYAMMKPAEDPKHPDNPFAALYEALLHDDVFPTLRPVRLKRASDKTKFLEGAPASVFNMIKNGFEKLAEKDDPDVHMPNRELLIFVDQFEELFTTSSEEHRDAFIKFLIEAQHNPDDKVRIVMSMRSDFFQQCLDIPELSRLINAGSYTVSVPSDPKILREMIERPAERANFKFEDGLVDTILQDTLGTKGATSGTLALMAYALDELYKQAIEDGTDAITFESYNKMGGVRGAIGKRAEEVFEELAGDFHDKNFMLQQGFYQLVAVNDDGTPTRKRWEVDINQLPENQRQLIEAFIKARLLFYGDGVLEVAHEALFTNWERLKKWVLDVKDHYILLRQLRLATRQWASRDKPDNLLWTPDQLRDVYRLPEWITEQFGSDEVSAKDVHEFIDIFGKWAERLKSQDTSPQERLRIGDDMFRTLISFDRMDRLKPRPGVTVNPETGIPDIAWLYCEGNANIPQFQIARYPVSVWQFETFYEATDKFKARIWWHELPFNDRRWQSPTTYRNRPVTDVTWTSAVAFCRWMTYELQQRGELPEGYVVRLPTKAEWLWAATGGNDWRFPWGNDDWQPHLANLQGCRLNSVTAVGMFPQGVSPMGADDMCGTVNEWCRDLFHDPTDLRLNVGDDRVIIGGAFNSNPPSLKESQHLQSFRTQAWDTGFRPVMAEQLTEEDFIMP